MDVNITCNNKVRFSRVNKGDYEKQNVEINGLLINSLFNLTK